VSVYDTGEDPHGVPYIVMEFVAGRTLRDVVHDEGRLLPQRALELTADICAALEVGPRRRDRAPRHQAGERHAHPVRPGEGHGLRHRAGSRRHLGGHADGGGHRHRRLPVAEQARGDHVDARSDLYSTGCLLFELVSGVPPFTGDSPVAVAYQHVREQPEPPSRTTGRSCRGRRGRAEGDGEGPG
jgi:serine/threonine-protein kinase